MVMTNRPIKLCLAASGGGHVRQMLDLEDLWSRCDYFMITEETPLTLSLAEKHPVRFIPHVALGQARLGHPFKMLTSAVTSLFRSLKIIRRERPDIFVTTGAGSAVFPMLWARLMGARIILIDSVARFRGPSAFARIAGPLAHDRISQSEEASRHWPGSIFFDPFVKLDRPRPAKQPLLFATVGATLPFDRLINLVLDAKRRGVLPEHVILQTGVGANHDGIEGLEGVELHETLPFDRIREILAAADIVVCHGGTGSIITAMREGCRIIAVPRRFSRGEHYDDHQWEITQAFTDRQVLTMVGDDDDFIGALTRARAAEPGCATTDLTALTGFLKQRVDEVARRKGLAPLSTAP